MAAQSAFSFSVIVRLLHIQQSAAVACPPLKYAANRVAATVMAVVKLDSTDRPSNLTPGKRYNKLTLSSFNLSWAQSALWFVCWDQQMGSKNGWVVGFKCPAGWLLFTTLSKGRKKGDQGNVNALSPHLSHNETPLWLPFSSTHVEFWGKGEAKEPICLHKLHEILPRIGW